MGLISSRQDIWEKAFTPYSPCLVRVAGGRRLLSFGQGSFGYDIRLSPSEFRVYQSQKGDVIDPKNPRAFIAPPIPLHQGGDGEEWFLLPAQSYGLGVSKEFIAIPDDCHGIAIGKSTYARCGIVANLTPLEAGWKGHLTLELFNASPLPVKLYAGEGIAQIMIFEGDTVPLESYAARNGKYQGQREQVVFPR